MTVKELKEQLESLSMLDKTRKIIDLLQGMELFEEISHRELELLEQRDQEDSYKLKEGIQIAMDKGVLRELKQKPRWIPLPVDGKLPQEILDEMMNDLSFDKPGRVIAICGDSGVGKGTLVETLLTAIPDSDKWSNGDIFRIFTYLALQQEADPAEALNRVPEMDFTELSKNIILETDSDIQVYLEGKTLPLDSIKNGLLKETAINRSLPSVARYTQGEVIAIVNRYLSINQRKHLILEGRKETLNHIHADYRIELLLENKEILGKRRAAQKLVDLLGTASNEKQPLEDFLQVEYL